MSKKTSADISPRLVESAEAVRDLEPVRDLVAAVPHPGPGQPNAAHQRRLDARLPVPEVGPVGDGARRVLPSGHKELVAVPDRDTVAHDGLRQGRLRLPGVVELLEEVDGGDVAATQHAPGDEDAVV